MPEAYKEISIMLRGGLNTAMDPSIIGDDQMQEASGMEYRPPRLGLFGVGGRTRADTGTMFGAKVFGLVYCSWDNTLADGYVMAFASPSATAFGYGGSAQSNGDIVFSLVPVSSLPAATHRWSASATAFADGCHYLNSWFFYNGADRNVAIYSGNITGGGVSNVTSFRQHGLMSVTATAAVSAAATSAASNLVAGTYEVWYTERGQFGFLESSFSGTVQSVTLSASAMQISVTLPAEVNSGVTTDNVYASLAGGSFPIGYKIGAAIPPGTTTFATQDLTTPYEVVAPPGGVPVSAWDEPPRAFSMRVFRDSLCCIDAEDRQLLRFSLPGDNSHFPSPNYIPVGETPFQDKLNALEVINDTLLAFSSFYGFRINYLPRHTDSEDITSARGNCYETFSHGHGAVSPRGVTAFSILGGAELCLFVCRCLSVHITDGETVDYASQDIDLSTMADLASLSRCVLKNNPKRHRVELYYVDSTDTSQFKRLDFYYHASLLMKGPGPFPKLPVLGPVRVPGLAATVGLFSNNWQVWCGDEANPRVWIEATGTEDGSDQENADGRITKAWKTKNFYFGGVNGEFDLFKVYTHQSQTTASGSYTVTGEWMTDDIGVSFSATSTVDQSLKGAQPHPAIYGRAQRFALRGEKTDGGAWQELNYLVFVVKSGQELHTAKSSS